MAVIFSDYKIVSKVIPLPPSHVGSSTCGPLALSNVRTPFLPVFLAFTILGETLLFLCAKLVAVVYNHDELEGANE